MKMSLDSIILSSSRFVGPTTCLTLYHWTMDKIDEGTKNLFTILTIENLNALEIFCLPLV